MPEVDWTPGLTEPLPSGAWVIALQGDGVLVEEGDIGFVNGVWNGQYVIRWGDHQCIYPLKHLARINKPRVLGFHSMAPCTSWRPAPIDGTSEGVCWPWIHTGGAA